MGPILPHGARSGAARLAPAALQEDKSHEMLQNLFGLGSEHNPASVSREERGDGAVAVGLVLGLCLAAGSWSRVRVPSGLLLLVFGLQIWSWCLMPSSYNWVCLNNRRVSLEAWGLCGAGYEAGGGVMERAVALAFYGLL